MKGGEKKKKKKKLRSGGGTLTPYPEVSPGYPDVSALGGQVRLNKHKTTL